MGIAAGEGGAYTNLAMNIYFVAIIVFQMAQYALDAVADWLNIRHLSPKLPAGFEGVFDSATYEKSQEYLKATTQFALIKGTFYTLILLALFISGFFGVIFNYAAALALPEIVRGLVFAGILMALTELFDLPFAAYRTFKIEAHFGFNRSTVKTFILDAIKSFALVILFGGAIFAVIAGLFLWKGPSVWVWGWITVIVFQLFMMFLFPVVILPLFNKFVPLEPGPLTDAIQSYARSQRFALKGIYTMDASKRSTKSNAFFVGFGKSRRVVLFDTLIAKHTVDELVAVLAHEIGHFKKRHILRRLIFSFAETGILFGLLSYVMNDKGFYAAFGIGEIRVWAALVLFVFLFSPLQYIFAVVGNVFSRRFEYEADRYAMMTTGRPLDLSEALKKLCKDNLANLTPHPLKVFLDYSHPPIRERLAYINAEVRSSERPRGFSC